MTGMLLLSPSLQKQQSRQVRCLMSPAGAVALAQLPTTPSGAALQRPGLLQPVGQQLMGQMMMTGAMTLRRQAQQFRMSRLSPANLELMRRQPAYTQPAYR